jgi:hypothetical protein
VKKSLQRQKFPRKYFAASNKSVTFALAYLKRQAPWPADFKQARRFLKGYIRQRDSTGSGGGDPAG